MPGYVFRSVFVENFKEKRAAFVNHMQVSADTLRLNPQATRQVSESLYDLVKLVYALKDAAIAMDDKTRGDPFVISKPFAFYSHNVPLMCNDIEASLLHWADMLVNTDGRKTTDGIVIYGIERMLASMEF